MGFPSLALLLLDFFQGEFGRRFGAELPLIAPGEFLGLGVGLPEQVVVDDVLVELFGRRVSFDQRLEDRLCLFLADGLHKQVGLGLEYVHVFFGHVHDYYFNCTPSLCPYSPEECVEGGFCELLRL